MHSSNTPIRSTSRSNSNGWACVSMSASSSDPETSSRPDNFAALDQIETIVPTQCAIDPIFSYEITGQVILDNGATIPLRISILEEAGQLWLHGAVG